MDSLEKKQINASYLIKDLIQGDEKVSIRKDFSEEDLSTLKKGLNLLLNNEKLSDKDKAYYLNNSWKLIYEKKPPTIEEFLTESWLGPVNEYIYPYIRQKLIEFWKPNSNYRHAILSTCIGSGKSFFSILSNLYIEANMVCLRNVKKYFNLAPSSIICIFLISFTLEKAQELYLDPLMEIVSTSPKFIKCRTLEQMKNLQKENPDNIYFSTAGTSAVTFAKGVDFKIGADPSKIIGLSVLSGSISELSFWKDFGFSDAKIWRMFNDLRNRVRNRFKSHFFARTIVDSSPNSLDTRLDKYIWNEADKEESNFLFRGSLWDLKKWEFDDLDNTFPVFKGSLNKEPKILNNDEIKNYSQNDIIHVPYKTKDGLNFKDMFEKDLVKSLKDFGGVPSGLSDKFISNLSIIESIFDENLNNIYTGIYVPANKMPERLIWNQIVDMFFIKLGDSKYEFYRSPYEIRYIAFDQSYSGDALGISMLHQEADKSGKNIIVGDFTITIIPTKYKINLQAIYEFILDLIKLGNIKFGGIYFDRFESEITIQNLERLELPVKKTSVDISKDPYNLLVSWMQNDRIKVGKSIFLKNNLKSLEEVSLKTKTKIEHTKGNVEFEGETSWDKSIIGLNAKDTSDSFCNAFYNCVLEYKGVPRYQYEEKAINEDLLEKVFKQISEDYSFITE